MSKNSYSLMLMISDSLRMTEGEINPLHEAAMRGIMTVIDLILTKGEDVNIGDDDGVTCLHNPFDKEKHIAYG